MQPVAPEADTTSLLKTLRRRGGASLASLATTFAKAFAKPLAKALASAFTILLLFGQPAVSAADIEVLTQVGFGERFRVGTWTPVHLSVQNLGPAFDASVDVSLRGGNALEGNAHRMSQRRLTHLASGVRRHLSFNVFLASFAHPLEITVRRGDEVVLQRQVPLRPQYNSRGIVLALSSGTDLDYVDLAALLGCKAGPQAAGEGCEKVRAGAVARVYPTPDQLPHVWYGYDGVDALIVRGRSLDALTNAQYDALVAWLLDGGRLIVSGTSNIALVRTSRLEALLPARPRGLTPKTDTGLVLHALDDGPWVTVTLNRMPLVAERAAGRGRVVYVAADVGSDAFRRWDGAEATWRQALGFFEDADRADTVLATDGSEDGDLLTRARASFLARLTQPSASWVDNVLLELPLPWPSLLTVLVFAFGYLALLAAADPSRPSRRKQRLLLLVLPAAVSTAVAIAVFVLPTKRGPTLVTLSTLTQLPGVPYAEARHELAVFSRERIGWRWQSDAVTATWRHVPRPDTQPPGDPDSVETADDDAVHWVFDHGETTGAVTRTRAHVAAVRPYVVETLVGDDIVYFPSTATALTDDSYEITNDGTAPWLAAWVVSSRGVTAVGSLEAGASTRTINAPASVSGRSAGTSATWDQLLTSAGLSPAFPKNAMASEIARTLRMRLSRSSDQDWLVALLNAPVKLTLHDAETSQRYQHGLLLIPVAKSTPVPGSQG